MAKKVAVMAFDPVNGSGLFQYLEAFFENGIPYKTFAVADQKEIKTNSGVTLIVDDVIANLKNQVDDYDALVFGCGDAIPKFGENAGKQYNLDMMEVIKKFHEKGKILIGHCAAAMLFEKAGAIDGKKVALHPLAKAAIQKGVVTNDKYAVDGKVYTAETENTIWMMMPEVIKALK